jgi:hypothetical protein
MQGSSRLKSQVGSFLHSFPRCLFELSAVFSFPRFPGIHFLVVIVAGFIGANRQRPSRSDTLDPRTERYSTRYCACTSVRRGSSFHSCSPIIGRASSAIESNIEHRIASHLLGKSSFAYGLGKFGQHWVNAGNTSLIRDWLSVYKFSRSVVVVLVRLLISVSNSAQTAFGAAKPDSRSWRR